MIFEPIRGAAFGASVHGVMCTGLSAEIATKIRNALCQYQVLIFPGQHHLSPEQEVAFYRSIDTGCTSVWRDQSRNPWEVFKVEQGNQAGTFQLPREPAVLVLGKGPIDHYGLKVTLGGDRAAYGQASGSQVLGGGALQWHIDGAFYGYPPCNMTQMRCIEAPKGSGHWLAYADGSGEMLWCPAGSTAFASGRTAFDLLTGETKTHCLHTRVHYARNPFQATYALGNSACGLRVVDTAAEQRYADGIDVPGGPVDDPAAQVYPLIWGCPITGRQALMPHPRCMHALEVVSDSGSEFLGVIESRIKVEAWMRPAISPEHVYVHDWKPGDLVLWNNRSIWHSATGRLSRDDRRVMHLTAFNGTKTPTCHTS